MQELQHLLDKLEIIRLRQEGNKPTDSFNIFRILRRESDEVNLHSRFIYELLNPKGSHSSGDTFLRIFANICDLPALSYDTVQVLREHANIDILIQDKLQAVVIENKIYAGDQHEQLKRYHDYTLRSLRTPALFYLTLDGIEPSDWSIGNMQTKVKCLAYSKEIDTWLAACIKEAATQPALRETIIQYRQLVHHLTGQNMSEQEKQQVLALMEKENNAEQASIIARNWNHVRRHTEWNFWNELLALVEKSYAISDGEKFTIDSINSAIYSSRNRNYYYGILFIVGNIHGNDLFIKIERGEEPMYYGFHYPSSSEEVNARLRNCLQTTSNHSNDSWAGWNYNKDSIDFYNFDTSAATLHLANPSMRQAAVLKLWTEIQQFVSASLDAIKSEFGNDFLPVLPRL